MACIYHLSSVSYVEKKSQQGNRTPLFVSEGDTYIRVTENVAKTAVFV